MVSRQQEGKNDSKNYNAPMPNGTGPVTTSVFIQNNAFNPDTLKIKTGTNVTWVNMDGVQTVTEVNGLFNSGTLGNGLTFHYLFQTPGTFRYHSTLQTSIKDGVVIVSN